MWFESDRHSLLKGIAFKFELRRSLQTVTVQINVRLSVFNKTLSNRNC